MDISDAHEPARFICCRKMSKNVIILHIEGEEMKAPVLKALANPARIFYVPYNLAVLNFVALFFIYMIFFISGTIVTNGEVMANPLIFLLTLIASHLLLAAWSKREPFLAQIFVAKIALFRKKIPNKLTS